MTRDEAINEFGVEMVDAVEAKNCEPTNRLMSDDSIMEWSADVEIENDECYRERLYVYYITDDVPADEIDRIDWVGCIDRYEAI